MQRSSDAAVCSALHNYAAAGNRIKQRGDSGEFALSNCETQDSNEQQQQKKPSSPMAASAGEEDITFYSRSLALQPWLLTAPSPGSISQERRANISSCVMWQFPPRGQREAVVGRRSS